MSNQIKEIYRFNTCDNVSYEVMMNMNSLCADEIHENIMFDFNVLMKRLDMKKIDYDMLKNALVPNQDKDKKEICFIFDTLKINDFRYGMYVFEKLIPLLDKCSTYSILCGDYINKIKNDLLLHNMLCESLIICNSFEYVESKQFFLVYFNRLTKAQTMTIVDNLKKHPFFVGYKDISHGSYFKSYISNILVNLCIKCKDKVIMPHPEDYRDEDNVNTVGYPFEQIFDCYSINDYSFSHFLSYTIETDCLYPKDVDLSLIAMFPKSEKIETEKICIDSAKWEKYLIEKEKGKGKIIEKIGFHETEKERFLDEVSYKIKSKYLFNLR